eukprot:CAMPEP_0204823112 /NCGR_PEP_ID=MMETSP1346-20131115/1243_1 /ASSEMBLY_ACC=CAM_ASM_000771 /TAXON_ID=215587 /ORGANISM="Aplanochytrium stocchinoi, Strain GSBS06" /LENGTH=897 /DNA_ID=CAMNT_0051949647 /DNA_START=246 /DNA_END=2939 /DNA_ORIENTATION=+
MAAYIGGAEKLDYEHVNSLERCLFCIERGVEAVDLADVQLGVKGAEKIAKVVAKNNTLLGLRLSGNKISDSGAKSLAHALYSNLTLVELFVSNNLIGKSGAKALAEALERNETLVKLGISRNYIGNEGAEYFVSVLRNNKTLNFLKLSHNNITASKAWELVQELKRNETIIYLGLDGVEDADETLKDKLKINLKKNNDLNLEKEKQLKDEFEKILTKGTKGPWRRSKLMVIGQGRAGKTALVRTLLNLPFKPDLKSTILCDITEVNSYKNGWRDRKRDLDRLDFTTTLAVRAAIARESSLEKFSSTATETRKKPVTKQQPETVPVAAPIEKENIQEETAYAAGKNDAPSESTPSVTIAEDGPSIPVNLLALPPKERAKARAKMAEERRKKRRKKGEVNPFLDRERIDGMLKQQLHKKAKNRVTDLSYFIWDLGGQDVFYTIHHLFMTDYGVYYLVFDMRHLLAEETLKQESIEYLFYWLNTVRLHTTSAPILLVGTFLDQVGRESLSQVNEVLMDTIKRSGTNQVVDNLEEKLSFFPLDNSNGEGIEIIREITHTISEKQVHVNKMVSIRWVKCLDDILSQKSEGWLPLNKVKEIAKDCDIVSTTEVSTMLALFHDLGVIFHLTATHALENIVTTNPAWMIEAVGKVIRDEKFHMFDMEEIQKDSLEEEVRRMFARGIVTIDLLLHLWGKNSEYNFLMDLMRRSMLLSDWNFGSNENAYLIPSLVGKGASCDALEKIKHPNNIRAKCVFDFSERFLPTGVYERLVCLLVARSGKFQDSEEPILKSKSCKVSFGEDIAVFLECEKDQLSLAITKEEEASKYLSMLLAMLQKIQFDAMSSALKWYIRLWNDGDYLAYEEAKRKQVWPWFNQAGDTVITGNATLEDLKTADLETFLGSLK